MGKKSGIEWTDATWSPVTGCTKVSPGCERCYAERMAKRFGWPWEVITHKNRLADPIHWKRPRLIFVASLGDLFHEAVPDFFVSEVFHTMLVAHWHTFLILTKRPKRVLPWLDLREWPGNVWIGVSIENQQAANERIPILLRVPTPNRFISCEPLLGPIDLGGAMPCGDCCDIEAGHIDHAFWSQVVPPIRWVIAGGESGHGARPCDLDWLRSLRDQCKEYRVPFFLKQLGGFPDKRGGNQALLDGQLWV